MTRSAGQLADGLRAGAAAVVVGVAAGLGGAALTELLHLVQHLAFGYTESSFLIGVQRASAGRRVAAMAVGGVLVGCGWWWLRRRVPVDAVSVTRALRDGDPRLPLGATVVDATLQIIGVGVGASLGREGAPRQVGAALADRLTRRWRLDPRTRRVLVAAGAGAGLAAVYDVPVAGALFTLELLLVSRRAGDLVLAGLSSAVATVVAWPLLTASPTYAVGPLPFQWSLVLLALLVGPSAGLIGIVFVRLTTLARTRAPRGGWTLLGVPGAFVVVGAVSTAYPTVLGNGKGEAELAFTATLGLGLAATLVVLKPLTTALCLGGGAIGGLLTPSLATGAAWGATVGILAHHVDPGLSVAGAAVIGAAAVLAATQRAPLTALVLTPELLGGGLVLALPLVLTVALASLTAGVLDRGLRPTWWTARAVTAHPGAA